MPIPEKTIMAEVIQVWHPPWLSKEISVPAIAAQRSRTGIVKNSAITMNNFRLGDGAMYDRKDGRARQIGKMIAVNA